MSLRLACVPRFTGISMDCRGRETWSRQSPGGFECLGSLVRLPVKCALRGVLNNWAAMLVGCGWLGYANLTPSGLVRIPAGRDPGLVPWATESRPDGAFHSGRLPVHGGTTPIMRA
jgi:hypothetical protein